MARKLFVEAVGTFFLVFTIGQAIIGAGGTAAALAPLAIGAVLTALVYAGGHISGAHYNPAVTLAVWIRGKAEAREVIPYWLAQFAGSILAILTVTYLKPDVQAAPLELAVLPGLLAEFLFTFALCYVVLATATVESTEGNSYYGLAIGFTVLAGAYAIGEITGAALNPAVAVALIGMGLVALPSIWIYLVANLLGGVAAALAFKAFDIGSERSDVAEMPVKTAVAPVGSTVETPETIRVP